MESCDRPPQEPIDPAIDGRRDRDAWVKAGCVVPGGVRNTPDHCPCSCLLYGSNREYFFLRFEFRDAIQPRRDLPGEVHLLWFYPGVTMYNSPAPLEDLPATAPLNYLFHHHLGLRLADLHCWFEEAGERYGWYRRDCAARVALDDCLDIAVPWASFPHQASYPFRLVAVLADAGHFRSYLPEGRLIGFQPWES